MQGRHSSIKDRWPRRDASGNSETSAHGLQEEGGIDTCGSRFQVSPVPGTGNMQP